MRQTGEVMQDDDFARSLGQIQDGLANQVARVRPVVSLSGPLRCRPTCFAPAGFAPSAGDPSGNRAKPGSEPFGISQAGELAGRDHKRLLRGVFGQMPVGQHAVRDATPARSGGGRARQGSRHRRRGPLRPVRLPTVRSQHTKEVVRDLSAHSIVGQGAIMCAAIGKITMGTIRIPHHLPSHARGRGSLVAGPVSFPTYVDTGILPVAEKHGQVPVLRQAPVPN